MKRITDWAGAAACVAALLASMATAQADDAPRHFKFLRSSALIETGGFAGVHTRYSVLGTFDFYDGHGGPASDGEPATFTDVDAWASHPILAFSYPLDELLRLSGLVGERVPLPGPLELYRFEGVTHDESTFNLLAAVWGPWMYLRGRTQAPPNTADVFEYRLRALARERPLADFTADDAVDGADLTTLTSHFGVSVALGNDATHWGDANGDGSVDGADVLTWQRQAGQTPPDFGWLDGMVDAALASAGLLSATSASAASVSAIPEPMTASLAALAGAWLATRRRVQGR